MKKIPCVLIGIFVLIGCIAAVFYVTFFRRKESFKSSNGIYFEDVDYPCTLPQDHLASYLTFCEKENGSVKKLDCYEKCWNDSPTLRTGIFPNIIKTINGYGKEVDQNWVDIIGNIDDGYIN